MMKIQSKLIPMRLVSDFKISKYIIYLQRLFGKYYEIYQSQTIPMRPVSTQGHIFLIIDHAWFHPTVLLEKQGTFLKHSEPVDLNATSAILHSFKHFQNVRVHPRLQFELLIQHTWEMRSREIFGTYVQNNIGENIYIFMSPM